MGAVMELVEDGEGWAVRTLYGDPAKDRVKHSGFCWDPKRKIWTTKSPRIVQSLIDTMTIDERASVPAHLLAGLQATHAAARAAVDTSIKASRAVDSKAVVPAPPGLAYLPFQRAGVAEMWSRLESGSNGLLLADEMGLGKTIQAIGLLNMALAEAERDQLRVLIIAPKIALENWRRELDKWLIKPLRVEVWTTKKRPEADVIITNYDIVTKLNADLSRFRTY